MKKILYALTAAIVVLSLAVFASAEEVKPVNVTLNGETVDCEGYGQQATIVEGRTMVPLRAIFEALGATVEWNQETKTVTSVLDETEIRLTIGENVLYRNSEEVGLDVPALIMNDRTLVPVRAIAESFGVNVVWDGENRTVVLMTVKNTAVNEYYLEMADKLSEYVPTEACDKEVIMTVDSIPVFASAARTAVITCYSKSGDEGFESEQIQKEIEIYHRQNAALINLAYEFGIELTQKDYDFIFAKVEAMKSMYGSQYDNVFKQSPYTKYYYHLYYSVYSPLCEALTDKLVSSLSSDVALDLLRLTVNYMKDNDYIRAKHILVRFPEGNGENGEVTVEQRADALARAKEILEMVNAMGSPKEFDNLVMKYNEDPGVSSHPGGYYFTKGKMVEEFETVAYSLQENQTSGIVETDYGYHIIQRLPLVDNDLLNSSEYASIFSSMLLEYLIEMGADYEIVYASNYSDRVEEFKQEYRDMIS